MVEFNKEIGRFIFGIKILNDTKNNLKTESYSS